MKLPFSWPKSSLSISVGEIAPQLTGTNGPCRRRLSSWMVRATTSLPDPLSPDTSTLALLGAMRPMSSPSFSIGSERPTMPANRPVPRCLAPELADLLADVARCARRR